MGTIDRLERFLAAYKEWAEGKRPAKPTGEEFHLTDQELWLMRHQTEELNQCRIKFTASEGPTT